jgi:hypothetical protein
MRSAILEIDGSPLVDALSLVASALREQDEIRVDDAWLAHHGCRVKPYGRFREVLMRELDAARVSRRALDERRTLAVVLAVCRRPLLRADLHLADLDRCVRFTRVTDR